MKYITPLLNIGASLLGDHLHIEVTTRCNLACKTCTHKDGVPVIDITLETLNKILAKHRNIRLIHLQGFGEPLLHPGFGNLCRIANEHSKTVWTFTNGTIFREDILEYLDKIIISLDTLNPQFAMELKSNGYKLNTVIYNILQYASRIPVEINFTQSFYNYKELEDVRKWCDEHGLDFNVTRVQNWLAPDESPWDEYHADVRKERDIFGEMPHPVFCQWKHTRWYYYRADGVRNPCCRRMAYREYNSECCQTCPD